MTSSSTPFPRVDAWYRSDQSDLVGEFYVPCLRASDSYDRAVGYFTSNAFPVLAQGLDHLVARDGRMRIVCSPILTAEDAQAIEKGYEGREAVVARSLVEQIERASGEFARATELLAWLIAEGALDVKVALPTEAPGIYHEKFGIFSSDGRDMVAFTGSPNETVGGILSNFEQIAVFSIDEGSREVGRIQTLRAAFDRLWSDRTQRLKVVPFPEAARQALIQHRPATRPVPSSGPRDMRVDLFPHQVEAIAAWRETEYRGILEMATGTGKTVTALAATRPMAREGRLVVILVPGVDLLDQWKAVIEERIPGAATLVCGGAGADWRLRASDFLQRWRLQLENRELAGDHDSHYLLATLDTATGDAFQTLLRRAGRRSVLIVDEVHRAGSSVRRRALSLSSTHRLGLSATPDRPWDDAGQRAIEEGVGPVCFTYNIADAIADGYLTPYEYRPRLVALTEDERSAYGVLSDKISQAYGRLCTQYPQARGDLRLLLQMASPEEAGPLQTLLFQRADVLKEAAGKQGVVRSLADDSEVSRCLVYCNDEEQVGATVRTIRAAGRSLAVFTTARLDDDRRKTVLRDFELGRFDFLVSIRCLDEGIDMPGAEHALILASSKSEREFVQRRGRVLRRAEGKTQSVIHDAVVLPVPLDADGFPTEPIVESERAILLGELRRAEIFASAAENDVDALGFLETIRRLMRQDETAALP